MSKNIKNKTKEAITLEDLKEVKKALDKHNVEFWLDCGVLLGAIREQKFIPWDTDIDLGAWEKDIDKIISACQELQTRGFRITLGRRSLGMEKVNSPVRIGILFYRLVNGKAVKEWGEYKANRFFQRFLNIYFWLLLSPHYRGINPRTILGSKNFIRLSLVNIGYLIPNFIKKWAAKIESKRGQRYMSIIPEHHFINLSTIRFYGLEFRIPSRVKDYLAYRYGKNWRIPRRNWVGSKEDGTIFKNDGTIFESI